MGAAIAVTLALVISITFNVLLFTRKKSPSANQNIRTIILSGIQNVIELATLRENFQSIVIFKDSKKIPFINMNIPGTTRKFIMKYYGTIVCGCDLSKVQISERYGVNRVKITLPRSEILDIYADVHSFEVYDQSAGIFTSVNLEDQNRELQADLEKMKTHSIQNGILDHSDDNVRKILTSVVASTGLEAEIVFTEHEQSALSEKENSEILQLENKNA